MMRLGALLLRCWSRLRTFGRPHAAPVETVREPPALGPPRHRTYGHTPEKWAELLTGELQIDPVSIWQIAGAGMHEFLLEGPDLEAFVRLMSSTLLENGAILVRGEAADGGRWVPILGAEAGQREMLEEALAFWRREGHALELWNSWWFALPSFV